MVDFDLQVEMDGSDFLYRNSIRLVIFGSAAEEVKILLPPKGFVEARKKGLPIEL